MSQLHLLRIPVQPPKLLQFATQHGVVQEDETMGYVLHAWLTALFGEKAPKPFRYFERRNEVLAYSSHHAALMLEHAQAFASPQAWNALDVDNFMSKPMPAVWSAGQKLRMEVLTCPVSRQGSTEKDVYLRALDRHGDLAPTRTQVYHDWFTAQTKDALQFEYLEVQGMKTRGRLLRRARSNGNRLMTIERPQILFSAAAIIGDTERFSALLARGMGRHRAFGFGMILLAPSR